jgi:hypothetical protein
MKTTQEENDLLLSIDREEPKKKKKDNARDSRERRGFTSTLCCYTMFFYKFISEIPELSWLWRS